MLNPITSKPTHKPIYRKNIPLSKRTSYPIPALLTSPTHSIIKEWYKSAHLSLLCCPVWWGWSDMNTACCCLQVYSFGCGCRREVLAHIQGSALHFSLGEDCSDRRKVWSLTLYYKFYEWKRTGDVKEYVFYKKRRASDPTLLERVEWLLTVAFEWGGHVVVHPEDSTSQAGRVGLQSSCRKSPCWNSMLEPAFTMSLL